MNEKSRMIGFRLNPADLDERRALALLDQAVANGWTVREVITRAILAYAGETASTTDEAGALVTDLQALVTDLRAVVATIRQVPATNAPTQPAQANVAGGAPLTDGLIASIRANFKPGHNAEE